jgi:branched-chain amino acid transport system substrate-binding protein
LIAKADPIISGKGNPYAVRLNSSNAQDAGIIAELALKRLLAKRIAFMTQNDAYGNGAQAVMEAEMAKLSTDYTIVATEKFPFTQTDFRVALANVKAANPDAVIAINASQSSGMPALIKQYRQANIGAQFVGTTGVIAATTIKVAGDAANGVLSADIYFPDVKPFSDIPENVKFVKLYEELHGGKPDKLPALGALAVQVWAQAVERVQSLDRVKVAEAIRGQSFDNTIFGKVRFQKDGQLLSNYSIYTVKDQKMVVSE